jgi:hypothetical protein
MERVPDHYDIEGDNNNETTVWDYRNCDFGFVKWLVWLVLVNFDLFVDHQRAPGIWKII